jgi:c-di-GMP-binding flagellar brake protein YcgR
MSNEEAITDNLDPYRVRSRREIAFVLDGVRSQRQLVKMSAGGSSEAVITSILAVDESDGSIWFDAAPSNTQNHRLTNCDYISFETKLDQIRVLFKTEQAEPDEYQGYPALRVPLPESLIRIQRREYYRVTIPRGNPVLCTFTPPGTETRPLDKPVMYNMLNISMGGVAVIDEQNILDDTPGAIYENCVLALPGGSITVSLEIKNVAHIKLANGRSVRHIGCYFANISNAMLAVVQRYILKLERDQNAKMTGFR